MKHIIIAACLLAAPAHAGEWSLEIPLVSKHIGFDQEFNEVHPGLGLAYHPTDRLSFGAVGVTKTSIGKPGVYVAASYDLAQIPVADETFIALGLTGGAAWYEGFSDHSATWDSDFVPVGAAYAALEHKGIRGTVGASYIPNEGTVLTARMSVKFGAFK
jgi:hypothetical protein